MAFEANNFSVANKTVLPKNTLVVECQVDGGALSKVLSVTGEAYVAEREVLSGLVSYSGAVVLHIVAGGDDGEIETINSVCPFSSKFENDAIMADDCACLRVKIVDLALETHSGLKILATIEESCTLTGKKLVAAVKSFDEDVCLKEEEENIVTFLGCASEKIEVEAKADLRSGIKRLLLTEAQVFVKNETAGEGYATVSGEVAVRCVILNSLDRIESFYAYSSFKEEIELALLTREGKIEAFAKIISDQVSSQINEGENASISFSVPVELCVLGFAEEKILLLKDVYSTQNELTVSQKNFTQSVPIQPIILEGKIDGSLTLDEDSPRVDKLLGAFGGHVTISNSFVSEGEVTVEGIASVNVVYLSDEVGLSSVLVEVPFVLSERADCDIEHLFADAVMTDEDVSVKKGRELFFDAKIKITVTGDCSRQGLVIDEVEVVSALPLREYGMKLVFAESGRTSWDIAKEAAIREEQLLSQNEEISFPLEEDSPLLIFNQL